MAEQPPLFHDNNTRRPPKLRLSILKGRVKSAERRLSDAMLDYSLHVRQGHDGLLPLGDYCQRCNSLQQATAQRGQTLARWQGEAGQLEAELKAEMLKRVEAAE